MLEFRETYESSFPRKRESRTWNLKKPFYPISFRADKFGFPLVRE
ncbi:pilS cassette protein [Neisseria meningitidis]|nr:pilS cassette protein [Neisseria meningitidis]RNJ85093.1 pilS cassette protein [Neisseria meningitidis]RNK08149.1 pilS cassette protein [Neisseria meningitidis]RNK11020.1 pilS cassette protein [Neisseria meningitidis]RNK12019.1 pilS cassette protein [Neisseria meningitidis]